jgi:hypothetical protein
VKLVQTIILIVFLGYVAMAVVLGYRITKKARR